MKLSQHFTVLEGVRNSTTNLEIVRQVFFKLNIHLDYYPEIPLLGIYPREIRNGHKNSHMQISLTALCTVVQKLEIATVTINRQMYKQAYYICAMEYC
jgi:hypothetical protein